MHAKRLTMRCNQRPSVVAKLESSVQHDWMESEAAKRQP